MSPFMARNVPSSPGTTRSAPAVPSGSSGSQCQSSSRPAGSTVPSLRYTRIRSPRWPTHRSTRRKPAPASWPRMISRIGRSPIGSSGLGRIVVYGRSRIPSPPASTTALIGGPAYRYPGRMPAWKVPLADVAVPEGDIALVADVYRSGWLSMGPRTAEFERALEDHTGAAHALATANGTAALHLICLAAGFGPGDEVIVPSLTFVASVNAIAYTGATPVFVDIAALERPWPDAAAVEAAITPRTRGVMTVAYGGHPGDIAAIRELTERRGLTLLEDAAHAIGVRHDGRHVGTFGAAGAFSFFSNKNLAIGEGGAVVTDDGELAA